MKQNYDKLPTINYPLVVIVGETASGKSSLALQLAQRLNGEIICADSWTVRREVNIGTAKPTPQERALVSHHLLDIVGPDEDFTAAVFKDLANAAIVDIANRQKLPIMVGGTGLYINGVLFDYGFLGAGDRTARLALSDLSIAELLHRVETAGLDASQVDQGNKRRLIRLLETNGQIPTKSEFRPNTLLIGLSIEREVLQQRITERVDKMLTAGLETEVQGLVDRYGWDCEALRGIGYREWRDYFSGSATLEATRTRIIKLTVDLAKRQRTWFKRNKSIHWLKTPVNLAKVVDLVTTNLNK